jgi:hypothetical protein
MGTKIGARALEYLLEQVKQNVNKGSPGEADTAVLLGELKKIFFKEFTNFYFNVFTLKILFKHL